MEIYVKKNNKLVNLGEGRIFSKKDLLLKEYDASANSKVTLTLNPNGGDVNSNQLPTMARNMFNRDPNATAATIQADDIEGVTVPNFQQNDPRSDMKTQLPSDTNPATIQQAAKNGGTIELTKNTSTDNELGMGENKESKRVMEMRENSIPFTKEELTSFLNSL